MGNNNGHYGKGASISPRTAPVTVAQIEPEGEWENGFIKWWDARRAYGWIRSSEGTDVFVHWRAVRNSSINDRELFDERPVRYKAKSVQGRSREVIILRLA